MINEIFNKLPVKLEILLPELRNIWNDIDETPLLLECENVIYNYRDDVFCVCMETGIKRVMCVDGFEKDRKKHGTLKKLCPAKQYGFECKYMDKG